MFLTDEARRENARSLAAAIGLAEEAAAELLSCSALISATPETSQLGDQVQILLGHTILEVSSEICENSPAVEIVIGDTLPRSRAPTLWVWIDAEGVSIASTPPNTREHHSLHLSEAIVTACYVCAAAVKLIVGDRLPFNPPDPFRIDLGALKVTSEMQSATFEVESYLAGAGAIGNAFLWTLRAFQPRGTLHVVDFDTVKPGNLNRQVFFTSRDLNKPKATQLALNAQPLFPALHLRERESRLQDLPERTDPKWLEELIVGVDSLRARRSLQDELPKRVFDASTTNIEEIILHFHEEPTVGACLSCAYPPTPAELEHAKHVAEALGVGLSEVQAGEISAAAAGKIVLRHPSLDPETLVGESYDSLFKALCGQQLIGSTEGRQVLAPFAFVSVLAGALLAIEYVRWKVQGPSPYNGWRVSPWAPPLSRLQRYQPRLEECIFCRDSAVRDYAAKLWGGEQA